jgi:hypothetical protein
MGRAGRQAVLERFSSARYLRNIEDVLASVRALRA